MNTPIRTTRLAGLLLPLLLGGCAAVNDTAMRIMATPTTALAVVGERVLSGEALLYTDRSGTLDLRSSSGEPALSCVGTLRYTSTTNGVVNLRCSDGLQTQLPYTALTEASGQGRGRAGALNVSLTYGLDPEPARAWLVPPPGKQLVVSGTSLRIE